MEEKKDTTATTSASKVKTYTDEDLTKEKSGFVTYHSFEEAELTAFIEFINEVLKEDPDIKSVLPIANQDGMLDACNDGIMLCKLINAAVPGTVDERVINRKKPLNIYQKTENLRLAISAAVSVGCRIVNITPQFIIEGKLHLIMGMIWQITRVYLFKEINLKKVPEIIVLAEPNEQLEDILKLSSEGIIVRWLNYHLKQAKQPPIVKDLGADLKNCHTFMHVLSQLDPTFDKSILGEADVKKRSEAVIKSSRDLGMKSVIHANSLLQGNPKLNLIFCCLLFNAKHGLVISQEKKKEVEKATLMEDSKTGTKEERTYQLWINCLGLEGVSVNDLYTDLKDGLVLLKVLNLIWPGIVENGKYEKTPGTNRYKIIANGNYIVDICKKKKLVLAGIGGMDIADAKPAQLLGIVWQLMRAHALQIVGGKSEDELVSWINKIVNKPPGIKNFKDPVLKNSKFLINAMAALEPEIIDWTLIKEGANDSEIELNAKYCISIARKLGAMIFLTWEDIKSVLFTSFTNHLS